MKAKVRLRKTDDGLVYVVKTERFIGEDDVNELRRRSLKQMKKERKTASMASIRKPDAPYGNRIPFGILEPRGDQSPSAMQRNQRICRIQSPV